MAENAASLHERSDSRLRSIFVQSVLIFTALISIYAITYSGIPRVEDEQLIAARAQSLIRWNELTFPQLYGNDRIRHLAIVALEEADFNAAVEPGGSLTAAAFTWISGSLGAGGTQGALVSNLYITALTAVALYLLVLSMDFKLSTAVVCALIFGIGTMVWPYSKTLFRDVLLMFFSTIVVLGFSLSLRRGKRTTPVGFALMGIGLLGAVLTKRTAWVLVPALMMTYLLNWGAIERKTSIRRWLLAWAGLGIIMLIIAGNRASSSTGLLARYGLTHYAYALQHMIEGVGGGTMAGFVGPFISPGKSIFLFSPILLLAPFGLVKGWREHRAVFSLALTIIIILVLAQALFYREGWAGIPIWGLRFMLLTIPLMIVLSAPIIDRALSSKGGALRWLVLGLFAVSVLVQIAGAAVGWQIPLLQWARAGWNPYAPESVWHLANLPIPIHLGTLFTPESLDMAWLRMLPIDHRVAVMPTIFLALAGICSWLVFRTTRRTKFPGFLVPIALLLISLGLILPLFPSLPLYVDDPAAGGGRSTYHEMLASLAPQLQPDDLVVVDSYGTPLWHFMMNHWSNPTPWYSLPYKSGETSALSVLALSELIEIRGMTADRVWLLQSADAPDPSLTEILEQNFMFETSTSFEGEQPVELLMYSSPS
ncbi:MAG: ArnT family glycosyltransferase [Anaerolineales bacterium]